MNYVSLLSNSESNGHKVGEHMELDKALSELRKGKKRKFAQSADLIINLKGLDLKRENINLIVTLPHKLKEKRICAFLEQRSNIIPTITKLDFPRYKDKKPLKNLVKDYDFFIASAPLMPAVATAFGKILGPAGKMPSPQLGILTKETDDAIKQALDKISKSLKIRLKEASIKVSIGNESMKDEEILENFRTAYNEISNALPKKKDNIKNVMIKFTMAKPIKLDIK